MKNLVLIGTMFCFSAAAQVAPPNTLKVPASLKVNLPPSEVVFQVDLADTTRSLDAAAALLKDAGISASNLVAFSTGTTQTGVFYFVYSFELTVPFASFGATRDRLETLRRSLANTVSMSFGTLPATASADDIQLARERALPDLIAQASKKAPALANSLRVNVGSVLAVDETDPVSNGLTTTFSVAVTFATQPQ
ncbi:MAG: hypothetical protein ABIZ80_02885 [Bryobacteraceae bacterium]